MPTSGRAWVGPAFPTGFGEAFEPEHLGPAYEDWVRNGFMQAELVATAEVGAFVVEALAAAVDRPGLEHLWLRSPSPTIGPAE